MQHEKIIILDFGGQYAHLIASRIRREQVLSEIHNPDEISLDYLASDAVKGIIFSGGPQSVYDADSPKVDNKIFELVKPILGICYGHQYMNYHLGGEVTPGNDDSREYGRATVKLKNLGTQELKNTDNNAPVHKFSSSQVVDCPLFKDIPPQSIFWMSHGDTVSTLPEGFVVAGSTDHCPNAAVYHPGKNFYGIQFHPEVTHSEYGSQVLKNFIEICDAKGDWTIDKWTWEKSAELKAKIGDKNIILFVSGGVDSTVSFAFLSKVIGKDRIKGIFVDTGLLRKGEVQYVMKSIQAIGADLTLMSEADRFLRNLRGAYDPEIKREIIGNTFLDVQRDYFAKHGLEDNSILAQGTIYPDTVETGNTKNAATIKTHHNRVPEIQKMIDAGLVIEPIADLYKDEVRVLGEALGLPHELVWRHPFPGPGLGVRILCNEKSMANIPLIRGTMSKANQGVSYQILPIKSVGVQGDFRTYRHPAILWKELKNLRTQEPNLEDLEHTATRLINQNSEINRCLYPLGYAQPSPDCCSLGSGYLTPDRIQTLQRADDIVMKTLQEMGLYSDIWQFPVVLVPISFSSSQVSKFSSLTPQESIILRPINSTDVMSASVGKLPWAFFEKVTSEILKDPKISAVFLDITSKPPGTVEWE